MFLKRFYFLLLAAFLAGCSSNSVSVRDIVLGNPVEISFPDRLNDSLEFLDCAQDIEYICLETTPESVLGEITKLIVTDSRIYVCDQAQGHGPAIFDIKGKFIKRLDYGSAPHEIGATLNMFYDITNGFWYIYDGINHKLAKYGKDGQFMGCHYLDYLLTDFVVLDGTQTSIQFEHQNYLKRIQVIRDDTISHKVDLWPIGFEKFGISKTCVFRESQDGFILNLPYTSEIYHFKGDSLSVKYHIGSKSAIDLSDYQKEWEMRDAIKEGEFVYAGDCLETRNYLYLKYITKDSVGIAAAYFLRDKNTSNMARKILQHHSLLSLVRIQCAQQGSDDVLAGTLDPSSMLEHPNPVWRWDGSNPGNLISEADMEKLRSVKPDDNPVIVLFKLKSEL